MSHQNQNYYGASGRQTQQHYTHYPSQRPTSTGPAAQYASQSQPVSQSFSSYSTHAYAPSGTYNLSDYQYGSTNYGSTTTAGRNNTSADLQNVAYASDVHDTVQRASAQSSAANQAISSSQPQHVSYSNNSYSSYSQQQPRPRSVNSLAGRSEQRSPRQLNPSGLPLPKTAFQSSGSQPHSVQQRAITSPQNSNGYRAPPVVQQASVQTPDHPPRTLPTITQTQPVASSAAYQWSNQQHTHSGSRDFETVDPTQVYDPWPEIQRKREAARAAKALEERAQAERQRAARETAEREAREAEEAEEARKAEEARVVEERRKAEEETAEQQRREEKRRRSEAEATQRAQRENDQRKKANTKSKMAKSVAAATSSSPAQAASTDVEVQMRALMAQMRQLNNQDPALLAKIWEEERQNHTQPSQSPQQAVESPASSTQKPGKSPAQKKTSTSQSRPNSHAQPPGVPDAPIHAQQLPQEPSQARHVLQQPQQDQTQQQSIGISHKQAANPRQPSRRMPPTGTTAWPNDKKDQISKAAADFLNAIPENHDKQIMPQEILDLLNRNPRYIELCEWLESQGMKLERASFARALLSAVPDINKPGQNQAPAPSAGRVNGKAQAPSSTENTTSSEQHGLKTSHPANYPNVPPSRPGTVGEHLQSAQSEYPPLDQPRYRSPYFVPTTVGTPTVAQTAIPTPPPQVPVAPMQYARHDKQNSGSRQGSSQREDSQKPATKADAARKRNFNEIVDLTLLSDEEEPPAKKQAGFNNDIAPTWAAPPDSVFHPHQPDSSNFYSGNLPAMVPVDDKTKNMDVVEILNRKYALRRSAYEVKTIARDVLIATGKHPEMRQLNGHLEILKENFKRVDNLSDLSTLRWDLIDPGDPPPEALAPDVIELDEEDADDEEEDVPVAQEQPQPRPRPCPAHPEPKALPPAPANPASPQAIPSGSVPSSTPQSVPKRKGRPPKSSAAGAGDARDRATPFIRDRDRERAPSSTYATPNKAQSPMASNSVGYSAFRQNEYGPDGQPLPKKKGRPVGWRKSIHSKEAQAKATGLSPQPFSASRASASRPSGPRTSQTSNGVVLIESRSPSVVTNTKAPSSYSVFKCEWRDCSAELHNMATLRKHVEKFHHGQNAQQKWPCYWTGCEENEHYMDKRTGKPNGFRVKEDLKDHVEFAHLGPRLWELGDGHAGGLSESHDSASEAYLSDSRTGRRVTPLVSAPSKDAVDVAMATPAPVPRGPGRPKLQANGQKPFEIQADLERRKKLVGPGLDRGGARLANEKRRMGFIDDEDFEEVVSDSD